MMITNSSCDLLILGNKTNATIMKETLKKSQIKHFLILIRCLFVVNY